jgi:hypothetical protein
VIVLSLTKVDSFRHELSIGLSPLEVEGAIPVALNTVAKQLKTLTSRGGVDCSKLKIKMINEV